MYFYSGHALIGERERANLVVQLARFFYIYIYFSTGAAHTVLFYVFLNQRTPGGLHTSEFSFVFFFLCGSLMDSECTAANVQPLVDDGTAPSAAVSQTARRRRASESTEACSPEAASCLRNCGGERERRLSQRRARDRARRAARSSPASETRLEQWRSAERRRQSTESPAERATRLQDLSTHQQERIAAESPAERATRLQDLSTRQQERIAAESPAERATRLQDLSTHQQERIAAESPAERATRLQDLSTRRGLPLRHPRRLQPGVSVTGKLTPTDHLLSLHGLFSTSLVSMPE